MDILTFYTIGCYDFFYDFSNNCTIFFTEFTIEFILFKFKFVWPIFAMALQFAQGLISDNLQITKLKAFRKINWPVRPKRTAPTRL